MHARMLHNGKIVGSGERVLAPGQVGVMNGWGVFSTLRVRDGVLFAYERHWARMLRDAHRMRIPMPASPQELEADLLSLVEANQAYNATLRVAIVRNLGGAFDGPGISRPFDLIGFTKELNDWGTGARLSVKSNARHSETEFAGAKITAWAGNLCWYEEAREQGFDEVVLLDEKGRVSECTSANLFAIFGNRVCTPTLSTGCLPGITREILLEAIQISGVSIQESDFTLAELAQADEIFMTSSTRDVLPVLEVLGAYKKSDANLTKRIANAFALFQKAYSHQRRSPAPVPAN